MALDTSPAGLGTSVVLSGTVCVAAGGVGGGGGAGGVCGGAIAAASPPASLGRGCVSSSRLRAPAHCPAHCVNSPRSSRGLLALTTTASHSCAVTTSVTLNRVTARSCPAVSRAPKFPVLIALASLRPVSVTASPVRVCASCSVSASGLRGDVSAPAAAEAAEAIGVPCAALRGRDAQRAPASTPRLRRRLGPDPRAQMSNPLQSSGPSRENCVQRGLGGRQARWQCAYGTTLACAYAWDLHISSPRGPPPMGTSDWWSRRAAWRVRRRAVGVSGRCARAPFLSMRRAERALAPMQSITRCTHRARKCQPNSQVQPDAGACAARAQGTHNRQQQARRT
jgi:hypothetical protein